jgi:hypothetical protein
MSCNNRVQCASKSLIPGESLGNYYYQMDLSANLHPDSICVGSGSGAGVTCSNYGALRRDVGGRHGIGDPSLIQRSWNSSGCAPGVLNDIPDTLGDPSVVVNPNGVALNKGANLTAFHTRNFQSSSTAWNERNISDYFMFPKNWSEGYTGLSSVGGNRPSRMSAACLSNSSSRANFNQPISMGSYGSYNVIG